MNNEEWRPVELRDSDCSYEVSNTGRVRVSPDTEHPRQKWRAGKVLAQQLINSGYYVVWLRDGGKSRTCLVHRLVAQAFCAPMGDQVNHKDTDKLNNHAPNLEWVTSQENVNHSVETGCRPLKLTPHRVKSAVRLYGEGWTQREIATLYGVTDVLISLLLKGKLRSYTSEATKKGGRYENTNRKHEKR